MIFGTPLEAEGIYAVVKVFVVAAPIPSIEKALFEISSPRADQLPLRILAALSDDVDDAIHGVWSPDRAARSANNLNAINVLQQYILYLPISTRKQGSVDSSAIDEYEHIARKPAAKTSNADGPLATVDTSDFYSWCEAQRVWNGRHP